MKNNDDSVISADLQGISDNLAGLIKSLLDDENYTKKHNATMELVQMGKTIVPQLHKLLFSKNDLLRKEIAKLVQLIPDRRSIAVLIGLLDDPVSDIRWIAAEGLIKIGRRSIIPLLKSVRDSKSLTFLGKGAHHVIMSLVTGKESLKVEPLLLSLDNYHGLGETAPLEASNALKTIYKSKS